MTLPGLGGAGPEGVFGKNSVGEQLFLWGVLEAIVGALIAPELQTLAQLSFEIDPSTVLTPAEVATAINRHFLTVDEGNGEAKASGVDSDRLRVMTDLAGDAPAPSDLAAALRRKLIPAAGTGPDAVTFEQGIAEGNLRDKWTDVVRQLAVEWPTPTDALDALLEGQVSHAEGEALYERFGGDPEFFQLLYNTRGQAPTPNEALQLLNRGIIPEYGTGPDSVSYEQAFLEGPWRNKWLQPFLALREYVTPPRTVTAMLREGAYTRAQAAAMYHKSGLTPEEITAYLDSASHQTTAHAKTLTESQLVAMYEGHLISRADVESLLEALRYDAHDAAMIIELADIRSTIASVNAAVTHIRSLFTAHKITEGAASGALSALQVPADQITHLMHVWKLAAAVNVRTLTEAQIVDAWDYGVLSQAEAESELRAIGYTPLDAWTLLSIKNKQALPGRPAAGPNPVGTVP